MRRNFISLKDQQVVLIGASSGMGLATAKAAAEAVAKVTLVGRRQDALERAVTEVGQGAQAIIADIGDEQAIKSLFAQVETLDHLVTAAADLTFSPIQQLDSAAAEKIIASKILVPFYAVKHAAPHLSKNGSITFFPAFQPGSQLQVPR